MFLHPKRVPLAADEGGQEIAPGGMSPVRFSRTLMPDFLGWQAYRARAGNNGADIHDTLLSDYPTDRERCSAR